ncbi:hemerythrin domain-containing protein [Clostridium grantii]|uniref:Hemerythrin-like domain-containing protein n=1 Tax=Clostridium grantii DSM 8605 TaxID=1121316 RepID=A0A1M5S6Z4_9CLOT|nr:hemerythrin domain-containing protein [Clostridium grantii]SHH33693.1 Hemerythrin-like domain-containing protein [Clostridium grantii DSM 8605]
MKSIEIMVHEHKYIKRMLKVTRKACSKVLNNEDIEYNEFFNVIDFIKNYADKHHHGKEENFLFNKMEEELGPIGYKLIRNGMLVEHDLGRLYIRQLEEAVNKVISEDNEAKLDLIANAISYTDLLNRHIDKEDSVIYTYAEKNLCEKSRNEIETACLDYEENNTEIAKKYIALLEKMEKEFL